MAIKVGIDQGARQNLLRPLQRQGLIELRQANELERIWSDVVTQQKKGFMLGHTRLGRDVLADEKIIRELERIIGPQNRIEMGHIYAAYLNKCEYFVTENPDDFIKGGHKEALESLLGIKIRRTKEFMAEIAALSAMEEQGPQRKHDE